MNDVQRSTEIEVKGFGTLKVTVTRFEPVTAYRMGARSQADNAKSDPKFMIDMLAGTSIIRPDDRGELENLSLAGGEKSINRAFRGLGLKPLLAVLNFAMEANFGDFFDESDPAGDPAPDQ